MLTVVESGEIKEIMHNIKFPEVLRIHKTQSCLLYFRSTDATTKSIQTYE